MPAATMTTGEERISSNSFEEAPKACDADVRIFPIRLAGEGECARSLAADRQIGGPSHDDRRRRHGERRMRMAKNGGAGEGIVVEVGASTHDESFMLRRVEAGEQHSTRPRSHGVEDR